MLQGERGRHAANNGSIQDWDGDSADQWSDDPHHTDYVSGRHSQEFADSGLYPQLTDPYGQFDEEPPLPAEGPFDSTNPPIDDFKRIDLGSIQLPLLPDVSIHPQLESDGHVSAFILVHEGSALQIIPFAAPRSDGAWADIRQDLRMKLDAEGYWPRECEGDFDVELLANLPSQNGRQLVRFLGIDGPRWFIRAMFTGAAATDPPAGETLVTILRNTIVVRGAEPRPVRDPLPLRMPQQTATQAPASASRRSTARVASAGGSAGVATAAGTEPSRGSSFGRATHRDPYSPVADQTIEIRGLPFADDDELALTR